MPDPASGMLPLPHAKIEHRIPGRMRLRVAARRGKAGFFQQVEAALADVPGVRAVRTNPATGSILIEHGGEEAAVLQAARDHRLFAAAPPEARVPAPVQAGAAPRATGAPPNLAAAGLLGAGLLQAARGNLLGSASENLWNAYSLRAVTGKTLPSAVLAAFGAFQLVRGQALGSAVSLFLYAYSARQMARREPAERTI